MLFTPTAALTTHTSPYHALYNELPKYSILRTFGCLCFPHIRPYNQHKLQFRSTPCINLGISPMHRGYKCLSKEGHIFISKDVIFDETTFPYTSLFTKSASACVPTPSQAMNLLLPNPPSEIHSPPQPPIPTEQPSLALESSSEQYSPAPDSIIQPSTNPPVPSSTNNHPMVTRSKTGHLKPRLFIATAEPTTVKQALMDPKWLAVMRQEYKALVDIGTWVLITLPPHRKAIGCKWVFRIKENANCTIKHKARLVANGYNQQPGKDFGETFSLVIKPVTIHVLLTLALTNKWHVEQIDVNNAFINGHIEEEIYIHVPATRLCLS